MKRSTITLFCIAIAAATTGGFAGLSLAKQLKPDITIVEGLNGEAYEADMDAAMKKYDSAKASGDFVGTMTPDQIINCGFRVYDSKEKHHGMTVGSTIASAMGVNVNQRISAYFVKDGNKFFEEQYSASSMVSIHNRFYEENDNTVCYWGSKGDWENYKPVSVTNEQYKTDMGSNISRSLRYIVSERTVLKDKVNNPNLGLPTTQAKKQGDEIIADVELDTRKAICYYGQQMKYLSDLLTIPAFAYLHLTVTLSASDLMVKNLIVYEGYTATLSSGISSPCDSVCKTVYEAIGDETIPTIHDQIVYPQEL